MAFKRNLSPPPRPDATVMTSWMAGIGMNFAGERNDSANIEDTLILASELGMDDDDLRVLSVLTTWLGVHHAYVNVDRLVKTLAGEDAERAFSSRVRAYWSAIATWLSSSSIKDRRFKKLAAAYVDTPLDLLSVGMVFQISRRGRDDRFARCSLRVPDGVLRQRPSDVIPPNALSRQHRGYRNRVMMGPSWRADAWTILEEDLTLSIAETARQSYCSFGTAWQVSKDFRLARCKST